MSDVEKDFDRLALLDEGGWTQNNHYHNFLLRNVPEVCQRALEIGCGTGAFSRRLAEGAKTVTALDMSSQMIRVAKSRSAQFPNLQFEIADVMTRDFPDAYFDCVTTIATLHHLPLREALVKMKAALNPGGVLIILDLFEPERNLLRPQGWLDGCLNIAAMAVSGSLRLVHNGRLRPRREVRAAWEEHGRSDRYPTMNEVRALCAEVLPLAQVRKHLLWRYSVVWKKS